MNTLQTPILKIKTETSTLAIELNIVKNFLRVDFNDDDGLIINIIKTATNQCEAYINKTLVERTYVYSLYKLKNIFFTLPYSPIKSIIDVTILNLNGKNATLDSSDYILDTVNSTLNFQKKLEKFYRLDVEYKAGLISIDNELIQAILAHISRMYEDRSGYSSIPAISLSIYKKYKQIML
jgi:uncharacterized phiE125 gp8 family phage protein